MTVTIDGLRLALFDCIQGVANKTLDIDRAKAISDLAQVIINAAKVECQFLSITNRTSCDFFPSVPRPNEPRLIKGKAQSGSP